MLVQAPPPGWISIPDIPRSRGCLSKPPRLDKTPADLQASYPNEVRTNVQAGCSVLGPLWCHCSSIGGLRISNPADPGVADPTKSEPLLLDRGSLPAGYCAKRWEIKPSDVLRKALGEIKPSDVPSARSASPSPSTPD